MSGDAPHLSVGGHNFNPNAKWYRSCCCHVKTFTIVFGILEIFTICFMLVAVLPDINSRMCEAAGKRNGTIYNNTIMFNKVVETVRSGVCDLNFVWLVWAVVQIISVNVMFYGIKNIKWLLFLPHLFLRCACFVLLVAAMGLIIFLCFITSPAILSSLVIIAGFEAGITIAWAYIIFCQARCCHFVKRSQETGFSISGTRPIGPATISLSDHTREQPPPRQLPPLRHTYHARGPPVYALAEKNNEGNGTVK